MLKQEEVPVTESSSDGDQEIDPEVFQLAAKVFDLARHATRTPAWHTSTLEYRSTSAMIEATHW